MEGEKLMGNVKIVDHGIVYTKPNAIFSYNGMAIHLPL